MSMLTFLFFSINYERVIACEVAKVSLGVGANCCGSAVMILRFQLVSWKITHMYMMIYINQKDVFIFSMKGILVIIAKAPASQSTSLAETAAEVVEIIWIFRSSHNSHLCVDHSFYMYHNQVRHNWKEKHLMFLLSDIFRFMADCYSPCGPIVGCLDEWEYVVLGYFEVMRFL